MISKSEVNAAAGYLTSRLGGNLKADQIEALWQELDSANVSSEWLLHACKVIVRDEDALPRNLTKAILARRPITREGAGTVAPINPNTSRMFTPVECAQNRNRINALLMVMASDGPERREILACGEASAREGDSVPTLRKWGGHIVEALDRHLEKRGEPQDVAEYEREEVIR